MKTLVSTGKLASILRPVEKLGLLLGLTLLVTATTCRPTYGTRVETFPSQRITEDSWLVADKVHVNKVLTGRENGFLRVQVDAMNQSLHDYQFEYRFRWLNEKGIEEESGWAGFRQTYCTAKQPVRFQGVAPNPRVTDFELLIRFPDRVH